MTYTQRRLNEYCKKFGLCKTGETCQCKKELKFIAETIHQALAEDRERVRQALCDVYSTCNDGPPNLRESLSAVDNLTDKE